MDNKIMNVKISVFGSSLPRFGEPTYQQGIELGRLLGERGFTVLNGGYIGTMEAVSKGAAEAGAHVIGVTCEEIESYRPIKPNRWVDEEIRLQYLRERIFVLISECDIAVALNGGVGTLNEIISLWNNMIINAIPIRPLILIGAEWYKSIQNLYQCMDEFIPNEHRQLISFALDASQAVNNIDEYLLNNRFER
jgi:uncharacterized protein (TIGR00730 family)